MTRAVVLHPVRFVGDHRFTRKHASSYLDGELDATSRRRVEGHAHLCPSCMRFLNGLRRTVTALQGLTKNERTKDEHSSITAGVLSRLREEPNRDPDNTS
ncbi:MAG: anti-sigma factor [Solirubrobacterales bacterium]